MAQPTRAAARCARLRRPFSRQNLPVTQLVTRIHRAVSGQCLALRKRRVPGAQSQFLSQKSWQLRQGLNIGHFQRLEVEGSGDRIVTEIDSDCALFVRSSYRPAETPS